MEVLMIRLLLTLALTGGAALYSMKSFDLSDLGALAEQVQTMLSGLRQSKGAGDGNPLAGTVSQEKSHESTPPVRAGEMGGAMAGTQPAKAFHTQPLPLCLGDKFIAPEDGTVTCHENSH